MRWIGFRMAGYGLAATTSAAGWNASVTIGTDGQWFELEREERAWHSHAHILRPALPGTILRGYQEYDAAGARCTRVRPRN